MVYLNKLYKDKIEYNRGGFGVLKAIVILTKYMYWIGSKINKNVWRNSFEK
jgi:hypothetical protein